MIILNYIIKLTGHFDSDNLWKATIFRSKYLGSYFPSKYDRRRNIEKPFWGQLMFHYTHCAERSMSTNWRNHVCTLHRLNYVQASKLSLHAVLSILKRKVTSNNVSPISYSDENNCCWQSAEIWLPFQLSAICTEWMLLM